MMHQLSIKIGAEPRNTRPRKFWGPGRNATEVKRPVRGNNKTLVNTALEFK